MDKKNIKIDRFELMETICANTDYEYEPVEDTDYIVFFSEDRKKSHALKHETIIESFFDCSLPFILGEL